MLVLAPFGASTVSVIVEWPTTLPGVTVSVRWAPSPLTLKPLLGATFVLEEPTVTVSSPAAYSGSDTVMPSAGLVGSSIAAGRLLSAKEISGAGGGGVPPEPKTVPGVNATPRNASLAGAVAISVAVPDRVPSTPLVSVILYSAPPSPEDPPLLVA